MLVLTKSYENMLAPELEKCLLWYHIKKQYQGGGERKLARWNPICTQNQAPPSYEKWTVEDKAKLDEMNKKIVEMKDTSIVIFEANNKREYDAVVDKIPKEERDTLRRMLEYQENMEEYMAICFEYEQHCGTSSYSS